MIRALIPTRRGRNDGENTTEADYEKVRSKYEEFDRMMNAGMQNYMVRPDVNRLVDFLKNPDNDENFKKSVLRSMMKEKLEGSHQNDFQGHLVLGRQFMQTQNFGRQNLILKKPEQECLEEKVLLISLTNYL